MSAPEKLAFEIVTDTKQTENSVKTIKTQLKEANLELIKAQENFGDYSVEALKAAKGVALLKDKVQEARETTDLFDPGKKFQAFTGVLQTTAAGFAGVQGAIGLFGTESAELEKQLLKVQSALALSEGLSAVKDGAKDFARLGAIVKSTTVFQLAYNFVMGEKVAIQAADTAGVVANTVATKAQATATNASTVATGASTTAMKIFRGALLATGVGALVIGLGLLVANFDSVKKAVLRLVPDLAKVGDFVGKLIDKVTDFVGITNETSRASDKLTKSTKSRNEEIERQIKLLGAQGGKEAEIAKLQKEKAFNDLRDLQAQNKASKLSDEEFLKNKKDLRNEIRVIDAQETIRQKTELDKRTADRKSAAEKEEATIKAAEEKKKKDFDDYIKRIQSEDAAKKAQKAFELDLEASAIADLTALDQVESDAKDIQNEKDINRANFQAKVIATNYEKDKENRAKKADDIKMKAEAEIQLMYLVGNLGNALAELAGKNTAVGKALAIASATVNTFAAANQALKDDYSAFGPAAGVARFLAVATTIAVGLKNVKEIAKVRIPGGGGGGGSAPSVSGGGFNANVQAAQAPIQSGVAIQQTQAIGTANVNVQNQQTIKAYVVERDITDSQDRISKIKAAATI